MTLVPPPGSSFFFWGIGEIAWAWVYHFGFRIRIPRHGYYYYSGLTGELVDVDGHTEINCHPLIRRPLLFLLGAINLFPLYMIMSTIENAPMYPQGWYIVRMELIFLTITILFLPTHLLVGLSLQRKLVGFLEFTIQARKVWRQDPVARDA